MGEKWTVGFSKKVITPADWQKRPYYLAGFGRGNRAMGVLDDIFVRCVYLDDGGPAGGVALAVVDCIGICNKEIRQIREMVHAGSAGSRLKSVNVFSTHVHSAPDTQGLWGKGLKSGRNKRYMQNLKQSVCDCILESVKAAKPGELFFGKVLTENMILDNRLPFVHDDHLIRLRFKPEDGSRELYILNIGCHPEMLGDKNNLISADWPTYCGREIEEHTGADYVFFAGAIGAITSMGLNEVYTGESDGREAVVDYGKRMGQYALSVPQETPVPSGLSIKTVERFLPVKNRIFALAGFLKLVKNDIIRVDSVEYKKGIRTEISLLIIGNITVFMVPGELFPEVALGGFFSPEESATGEPYPYLPLFDMAGDGEKMIFGLANDQVGYIIPDNDFYISKKNPYAFWDIPEDRHGRTHYEETTCSGPYAAEVLRDAFEQLLTNGG